MSSVDNQMCAIVYLRATIIYGIYKLERILKTSGFSEC